MTLTFRITLQDYKRSAWLHMKPRITFAIVGIILVVLGTGLFIWSLVTYLRSGQLLIPMLILGGSLLYFTLLFFVIHPLQLARNYRKTKLLQNEFTAEITETHLAVKSPHSEAKLPWDVFLKWKADNKLILLYQGPNLYHLFPRSAFTTEDDFQSFQSLLKSKVPSK